MRCFIAIDIPKKIKEKISHESQLLHKKNIFKGKATEKENLHLTLKFLGEVSEEQIKKISEKLRSINFKKFKAKVSETGVFDENIIKIIWLKINGPEGLQKEIDENLKDLFNKEARFMSHLTIARVQSTEDKDNLLQEIKKIKLSEEFIVDKFELMKSELFPAGPKYKILEEFKLSDKE